MMKKTDRVSLQDAFRIHWRAAKDINRRCPGLFPAEILLAVVTALFPYATIYLSARLIDELASRRRPEELARWAVLAVGITAALALLKGALNRWENVKRKLFSVQQHTLFTDKFLQMDFADVDKQETQDMYAQIRQSANWGGWGFSYLTMYCGWLVEALAGILGAAALTVSLFTRPVPESAGSLTALNHPIFLAAILAVMAGVTILRPLASNMATAAWASLAEESRFGNRIFFAFGNLGSRKEDAMDLRMYNQHSMARFYMAKQNAFGIGSKWAKQSLGPIGIFQALADGAAAVLSGVVYVFVCLKAWAGAFGVGSVTQYVGAVTTMSANVSQLIQAIGHMRENSVFLKAIYEFLDIPNQMYQGSLTTEKRADRQYEVEFKDVSFKYPGSELWALRHVSLKFRVGKRLAVVGENGSGKTTFIKLLCRLYDPDEGEILLNGIDIRKYDYRDYMDIFSVVFQDFQILSQPLGANVAGSGSYDRERARKALTDAGFGERLSALPDGLDTQLYKEFGEDGVDVSGGEAQKIAIARALYKDAPFIILDEPTAALDPIAEAEIYAQFNQIAGDKTAIYISHRLSSCKFCDEIVVFHEGAVIQQGSHDTLVRDEGGKYHQLWHAQAQYYAEKQV